jgi:AraC family transcriptional regulator of adaptative response / DNA-3-methyladenine glycosylase II
VDGFEVGVRAIVGQQISVVAARGVLKKLVTPDGFPSPRELLDLPDERFAMPGARRETLRALARAVAEEELDLDGTDDRDETLARLMTIPGVGEWTAQYVALRALGDPDAFMPTDVAVRRGARAAGIPDTPQALAAYAERWRPWRSYALIRLWRLA